jgi:hypothetical protein
MVAEFSLADVVAAKSGTRLTPEAEVNPPRLPKVVYLVEYVNRKQPAIQYIYGKYPTQAQAQRALEFVNSFPQYQGYVTEKQLK